MALRDLAFQELLGSLRECAILSYSGVSLFDRTFNRLFTSGARHDLTIVAGKDYHVHSSIVCGRSKPLMRACNFDSAKAPIENPSLPKVMLHLSEDDPYAVDCMLQYFYHLFYTLPASAFERSENRGTGITDNLQLSNSALVVHARVYAIAEKYNVQGLKILAAANFRRAAAERWNTDDFLAAAYEVFQWTDETDYTLRDVIVHVFRSHKGQLLRKKQAESLLINLPALEVELLKDTYQPPSVPTQHQSVQDQLAASPQSRSYPPRLSRRKRAALRDLAAKGGPQQSYADPYLRL